MHQLISLGKRVGLSDHSLDPYSCIMSFAHGVRVFEKHFTLSRSDGGPDADFSLEPDDLKSHIEILSSCVSATDSSQSVLSGSCFGRVVYATVDITIGDIFTPYNISSLRPHQPDSVTALDFNQLIGSFSNQNYKSGQPIACSELSQPSV